MTTKLMNMEDLAAPSARIARPELLMESNPAPTRNYWALSRLVAALESENAVLRHANRRLAPWIAAELEDPDACTAMQDAIAAWFAVQNA